jgi:hypothetical protein
VTALFISGNTRQYTFGNAALAAHLADLRQGGHGLTSVFVLHSPASEVLLAQQQEWRAFLAANGVEPELFVHFAADLATGEAAFRRATDHIKMALADLERAPRIYIDLTNGQALYRAFLASVGYILGVTRQFLLDPSLVQVAQRADAEALANSFWTPVQIEAAYVELPSPSVLDSIASYWLTDVRRFRATADDTATRLLQVSALFEPQRAGFVGDFSHAVRSWFSGERQRDGSALGGAVRYAGRAFEELIRTIYKTICSPGGRASSPQQMVDAITAAIQSAAVDYDPELIEDIARLLWRLRNASAHEQVAADFGQVRARLSIELLIASAAYFGVLHDRHLIRPHDGGAAGLQRLSLAGRPGEIYYFGLDGDDTGRRLEELFQAASADRAFRSFSKMIDAARKQIADRLAKPPLSGEVLFCSGDDILFKAAYVPEAIEELRSMYQQRTSGLTCSVGYGKTPREAYVALKMAKASPGKNCIAGVRVVE